MIQVRNTLLPHKGLSWVFITQARKKETKSPIIISILPVLTYIHISSSPPLCLLSHIRGLRLPWPLPLCPSSSVSPSVCVRTFLYRDFMFKCSPLGLLLCFDPLCSLHVCSIWMGLFFLIVCGYACLEIHIHCGGAAVPGARAPQATFLLHTICEQRS